MINRKNNIKLWDINISHHSSIINFQKFVILIIFCLVFIAF